MTFDDALPAILSAAAAGGAAYVAVRVELAVVRTRLGKVEEMVDSVFRLRLKTGVGSLPPVEDEREHYTPTPSERRSGQRRRIPDRRS